MLRSLSQVVRRPVVAVGNSIGGYISASLAGDYPTLVRGLVLVNSAGRLDPGYAPAGPDADPAAPGAGPPRIVVDLLSRALFLYLERRHALKPSRTFAARAVFTSALCALRSWREESWCHRMPCWHAAPSKGAAVECPGASRSSACGQALHGRKCMHLLPSPHHHPLGSTMRSNCCSRLHSGVSAQHRFHTGENLPSGARQRRCVAGGGNPARSLRPGRPGRVQARLGAKT